MRLKARDVATIGCLNEKPLHAALKEWYREEGDEVEAPFEGFVVDLVRDGLLIEIQTRGFSAMRPKFDRLLDSYAMRLVHPVAAKKWIVKLDEDGREASRRRSPKRSSRPASGAGTRWPWSRWVGTWRRCGA